MRLVNFDGLYLNVERIRYLIPLSTGGTVVQMSNGFKVRSPMGEAELRFYAGLPATVPNLREVV